MARTDSPNISRLDSEEKKESPSNRKSWGAKKTGNATVWPCTIDGCDKQFAREADLKRHQRTTKLHSMPSYACPQCHATFTRTDAQRRHQKSRHNGVVIEGDAPASTPVSPSSTASTDPGLSRKGPKKYYRDETTGFTPTYSLYPATTGRHPAWTPVNWSSNSNTSYNPHYAPSPYYRSSYTRGPTLPPLECGNLSDSSESFSDSPRSTPISPTVPPEAASYTRVPVEPSIARTEAIQSTPEEVEVALQAVMKYVEVDSASRRHGESSGSRIREDYRGVYREQYHREHYREEYDAESPSTDGEEREQSMPLEDLLHNYDSPVHRPGSLQDILTEDCEPIFPSEMASRITEPSPLARRTDS
ncbi:hypothetical protein D9611_005201 [Ephemerocybe angulata]|uniref:C2H2-type domain-containing protein n=1 Tax=Ephemerocybe angulata TaxID=980116 RepID=A0A8H5FD63_9AGAR|nr:hypothetical protein D9611_005201 [Tulosesus angulatus]